jgi:protein-S-isoprenylcysteine O-methyltransferase Ste14
VSSPPVGARIFAWTGAALFAASLVYFLFSYVVTFGEIAHGPVRAADVATNVALFSVFAVHHSLFARERMRALVARIVSPSLERSVYVWAASLMLIGVCAWWRPLPGVAWQVGAPVAWLLPATQLAGAWLALRSAAVIDVWDLAGVRAARAIPNSQPPTSTKGPASPEHRDPSPARSGELEVGSWEFKTEGPYGWVRHPIYLGWFLLVFAVATMTMTRFAFALISCAYVLVAIPLEERSLRRASAGRYDGYMRKVRWKLVPYLY